MALSIVISIKTLSTTPAARIAGGLGGAAERVDRARADRGDIAAGARADNYDLNFERITG